MPLHRDIKRARRVEQTQRGHSPSGMSRQVAWRLARGRRANASLAFRALEVGCTAGSRQARARVILPHGAEDRAVARRASAWTGDISTRSEGVEETVLLYNLDVQAGRRLAAGPSQGAWADLAALRVPPCVAAGCVTGGPVKRVPPQRNIVNEVDEA